MLSVALMHLLAGSYTLEVAGLAEVAVVVDMYTPRVLSPSVHLHSWTEVSFTCHNKYTRDHFTYTL